MVISNLKSVCQQAYKANRKMPAGILVVLAALIITTPLCNQIFSCGCTWPWQGLDNHCNFHVAQAPHKCPWCVSWLAAGLSLGSALLVGYSLSMSQLLNKKFKHCGYYRLIFIRFSLGLSAFTGIAYLGGVFSALMLDYPINLSLLTFW